MERLTNHSLNSTKDICSSISKIKQIFEYYCQYGDRLNYNTLHSFKYIKLFRDSGLLSILTKNQLELIYKAENKSNTMTFNQFLNSLIKTAKIVYSSSDLNEKSMTTQLIQQHIIPQCEKLASDSLNFKVCDINIELENKSVMNQLIKAAPLFFEMYSGYFKHEISICDQLPFIKDQSLKKYYQLLKDYEIAPGMISKILGLKIYQSETLDEEVDVILRNKQELYFNVIKLIDLKAIIKRDPKNNHILGQYFTFFKFLRVMLKLADVGFQVINLDTKEAEVFNSQIETYFDKLILFMQKIDLSQGFIDLQKKTNKTRNKHSLSFLYQENPPISNELIKSNTVINANSLQLNQCFPLKFTDNNTRISSENIVVGRSFNDSNTSNKISLLIYHNNLKDLCFNTEYINSHYGDELLKVFVALSQYGNTTFNRKRLNSKQFFKMLLDCSLVNCNKENVLLSSNYADDYYRLEPNDVDTIFIKLCNIPAYETSSSSNQVQSSSMSLSIDASFLNTSAYLNNGTFLQTSLNQESKYHKAPINSSMSIGFDCFIISIEILAQIAYPHKPIKEGIDYLMKALILPNMLKVTQHNNELDAIFEQLNTIKSQKTFKQLLRLIKTDFMPIFKYYSKEGEYLTYEQLLSFARDFRLFPDMTSIKSLNEIFFRLMHSGVINLNAFIDFISICGTIADKNDIAITDKIVYFIDQLVINEGVKNILRKGGRNNANYLNTSKWVLNNKSKQYNPERYIQKTKQKETFANLFLQNS